MKRVNLSVVVSEKTVERLIRLVPYIAEDSYPMVTHVNKSVVVRNAIEVGLDELEVRYNVADFED